MLPEGDDKKEKREKENNFQRPLVHIISIGKNLLYTKWKFNWMEL